MDERGEKKETGSGVKMRGKGERRGVGDSILQLPTSRSSPDMLIKWNKMVRAC